MGAEQRISFSHQERYIQKALKDVWVPERVVLSPGHNYVELVGDKKTLPPGTKFSTIEEEKNETEASARSRAAQQLVFPGNKIGHEIAAGISESKQELAETGIYTATGTLINESGRTVIIPEGMGIFRLYNKHRAPRVSEEGLETLVGTGVLGLKESEQGEKWDYIYSLGNKKIGIKVRIKPDSRKRYPYRKESLTIPTEKNYRPIIDKNLLAVPSTSHSIAYIAETEHFELPMGIDALIGPNLHPYAQATKIANRGRLVQEHIRSLLIDEGSYWGPTGGIRVEIVSPTRGVYAPQFVPFFLYKTAPKR